MDDIRDLLVDVDGPVDKAIRDCVLEAGAGLLEDDDLGECVRYANKALRGAREQGATADRSIVSKGAA